MTITDHAYDRAKERCGLNKRAFNRMLQKAIASSISHGNTKGRLFKYIQSRIMAYTFKCKVLVHDKYLILYLGETVITIYQIPRNLLPITNFLKETLC